MLDSNYVIFDMDCSLSVLSVEFPIMKPVGTAIANDMKRSIAGRFIFLFRKNIKIPYRSCMPHKTARMAAALPKKNGK